MEEPIFYVELVNQNQTWTAAASTVCVTVVILYPPRLSTMRTWGIFLSSFTEFPGATMRRERVEAAVRAAITDHMSTKYDDPHWYTDPSYFKNRRDHSSLL